MSRDDNPVPVTRKFRRILVGAPRDLKDRSLFHKLSLIPFLGQGMLPVKGVTRGINYGSDKVRFINMVRVGKRVRLRQKLLAAEPRSGGLQLKNECTIEIEGEDRPACVAETITIVYGA